MNSTNSSTQPDESPRSVEEAWQTILQIHGVPEKQAELVYMLAFGSPSLTLGQPTANDVRDTVTETLNDSGLEDHLNEDSDPSVVRKHLLEALDLGLEGKIGGPVSAPRQIALPGSGVDGYSSPEPFQITADGIESIGGDGSQVDNPPVPGMGAADPNPIGGLGAVNEVDDDIPEDLQGLVDLLEDVIDDFGYDLEEIQAALNIINSNRESDE